ncbi:MAG: NAD(P)/FAD-dependent oxidoreductase [Gemmatimonadota bacterium]
MASPTIDSPEHPADSMPGRAGERAESFDAVIVGAGPAGSATAAHLADHGFRVALLDRADFPRDKACSEYMGPGAVALLDRLNVTALLRSRGARTLKGTTVIGSRGSRLTGQFALASPRFPAAAGLSVARWVLDHVLLERAKEAGAHFFPRSTVEDLLIENGQVIGVRARVAGGETLSFHARVTVGADGIHSVVARRMGGVRSGAPRRMGFVAHVAGVSGLTDLAEMHVGPEGYVGLNPLSDTIANVALVVPRRRARKARGQVESFFFEALATFPGVGSRVSRAGMVKPVLATGPFSVRARHVTANGALLVGDAADFFDPFTGEGIYSALRGAQLAGSILCQALIGEGPILARHLAAYARARRQTFRGKWAVERMIGYGMLAPALFDHAVGRLARTGNMADTLIGVTADFVPAGKVLNPVFLSRMVL